MSTPHIEAKKGDFAATVLMPGDPLRAKFIAETFLENPQKVTGVRGMLGYTGTYRGQPISVMGSGMGMPSIGIYSYELFSQYGVENIIRIGSAGSYSEKARLFDVMLATAAYSESSYASVQSGYEDHVNYPDEELCNKLRSSAKKEGVHLVEGIIHSCDVFYTQDEDYWKKVLDEQNALACEMESYALFHNAAVLGKKAACLVTISDQLFDPSVRATQEERQSSFTQMMRVALGVVTL